VITPPISGTKNDNKTTYLAIKMQEEAANNGDEILIWIYSFEFY
jgi:hypothetical protein